MYEVKDRYDVIKSSNDDAIQAVVFRLQKSLELTRETATKLASVYATPELMNSFNWINGDIFCRDLVELPSDLK